MPDHLFVTGKLAADALMLALEKMEPDFQYEVAVLNISVAALMDTRWIARHLSDAIGCDQVMIPGWCPGDLSIIENRLGVPVIRGPKDLKDLPVFFGRERIQEGYGEYRVRIIAEIVEAYRMPWDRILDMAEYYQTNGADIIDLGCPPQGGFPGVGRVVAGLKERGYTVSLDCFDPESILCADEAGMDLLLSVNSQNLDLVPKLHCKVVVIPGKAWNHWRKTPLSLSSGVCPISWTPSWTLCVSVLQNLWNGFPKSGSVIPGWRF